MLERLKNALPLPPVRPYDLKKDLTPDVVAALAVVFLGVPQGMAYATIAGLPPAMGLYAAAIPVIVGSIFRSSRHVVAGPTNALSLLVGAGIAAGIAPDPVSGAVTLAVMVGVIQLAAGVLRLGTIVDYISSSVVLGYITGAGVLIGIGQLYNFTGTAGDRGRIWVTVGGWVDALALTQPIALGMSIGTVVLILIARVVAKKIPGAVIATVVAVIVSVAFNLEERGLKVVSDIASIPAGLPPITLPDLALIGDLLPLAIACTVLSLIESNAVARSIAQKTGDRLNPSVEFSGQGLSNIAAGFFGGYPISGSLSRSALNHSAGAHTRLAGVITGALMLVVLLLLGPILDHTPVAALAGILVVVAYDLVDVPRIKMTWGAGWTDRFAFLATLIGTWTLNLDDAIYFGVTVSIVLFLRRASLMTVLEVAISPHGEAVEQRLNADNGNLTCPRVRILQLQGTLFFGAANELQSLLDDVMADEQLGTLVLRMRRTSDMDATVAAVLGAAAERMRDHGQRLILQGVGDRARRVLDGTGTTELLGAGAVRPVSKRWLAGLKEVVHQETENNLCGDCKTCPLVGFTEAMERPSA